MLFWALAGCQGSGTSEEGASTPAAAQEDPVKRGEYLVSVGACNDCHTPLKMGANGPEPDESRLLSGHPASVSVSMPELRDSTWVLLGSRTATAYAGPWGLTFAVNLTPHETGLGVWTEDMFVHAIRSGKHMGTGRPIFPPMPWQAYSRMTDDDLRAVYAYLQSVPPIENSVPQYVPAPGAEAPAGEHQH